MSYTVTVSPYDTFVYDTTAQGNTPRPSRIPLLEHIQLYYLFTILAMSQALGICNDIFHQSIGVLRGNQ